MLWAPDLGFNRREVFGAKSLMTTEFARFQMLFGTTAEWSANSTFVALQGEFMVNIDTSQVKIGDGVSTYAALPFVGAGLGSDFATSAEVLAGLISNKAVAPDTLLANYPQKSASSNAQSINADWSLNASNTLAGRTTITLQPRTGTTGASDAMPRSYVDGLFAGSVSGGASDVGKAPILNSSGVLDTSFIPTENLPGYRGLFNPVTGSPALQDTSGGGTTPVSISGDYFIAEDSGFYNFATGTPGAGTTVNEGAQVIFNATTNAWSVVDPSGTTFDPGAVRLTPANASQTTITPGGVGVPNLTLQQIASQTADVLRLQDSGGTNLVTFDTVGTMTGISVDVPLTAPTPASGLTSYPSGISTSAVLATNDWPVDGKLITVKESSTVTYQIVTGDDGFYTRSFTGGSWSDFARLAPNQSPGFTGSPTAPTPVSTADDTQLATTAFVVTANENPRLTQGRLSLTTSALPSTVATSTTLYYIPYEGNKISLYDTTRASWVTREFSSVSTTTLGVATTAQDIFMYWTGTAVALERVAWTTPTLRATDLAEQDGVLVKSGDASRKYVGSYFLDGSAQLTTKQSGIIDIDTTADRDWNWCLYNLYNQIDHNINIKLNKGTTDVTLLTNTSWNVVNGVAIRFQLMNGFYHPLHLIHTASFQLGDARCSWSVDVVNNGPTANPGNTIGTFSGSSQAASVEGILAGIVANGAHSFYPTTLLSTGTNVGYRWRSGGDNDNTGSFCTAMIKA